MKKTIHLPVFYTQASANRNGSMSIRPRQRTEAVIDVETEVSEVILEGKTFYADMRSSNPQAPYVKALYDKNGMQLQGMFQCGKEKKFRPIWYDSADKKCYSFFGYEKNSDFLGL